MRDGVIWFGRPSLEEGRQRRQGQPPDLGQGPGGGQEPGVGSGPLLSSEVDLKWRFLSRRGLLGGDVAIVGVEPGQGHPPGHPADEVARLRAGQLVPQGQDLLRWGRPESAGVAFQEAAEGG